MEAHINLTGREIDPYSFYLSYLVEFRIRLEDGYLTLLMSPEQAAELAEKLGVASSGFEPCQKLSRQMQQCLFDVTIATSGSDAAFYVQGSPPDFPQLVVVKGEEILRITMDYDQMAFIAAELKNDCKNVDRLRDHFEKQRIANET